MLCLQSNASGRFLKKCIDFVEQLLKFSQFEGSKIPEINFANYICREYLLCLQSNASGYGCLKCFDNPSMAINETFPNL